MLHISNNTFIKIEKIEKNKIIKYSFVCTPGNLIQMLNYLRMYPKRNVKMLGRKYIILIN